MPEVAEAGASVTFLSDFLVLRLGNLANKTDSHTPQVSAPYGSETSQQFERVRLLYDLSRLWGIDLRMVAALGPQLARRS